MLYIDSKHTIFGQFPFDTHIFSWYIKRNSVPLVNKVTKINDYQQLVEALETLTAIVGEGKNHFLTPLMGSIDTLIEKCRTEIEEGNEEGFDMKVRNQPVGSGMPTLHRSEKVGRPATLPRVKLADLLAQEPNTTGDSETARTSFKPHRPEKTGRPANLPRLKLAALLAQEPEHTESEEIDTGPAVGHEVW